jgi:chorismate-pyruvate lyase
LIDQHGSRDVENANEDSTRNMLDMSAVRSIKSLSHVDWQHNLRRTQMIAPIGRVVPRLKPLFALFSPGADVHAKYKFVPGSAVPKPYHGLLVHERNMTPTLEQFHNSPVDVRILARHHEGDAYARKITLSLQSTGQIVLFAIARVDLSFTSQLVRNAIVAGQTPLGRILLQHHVHQRIETVAYLRIRPGSEQMAWFGLSQPRPLFGRLALIHCDRKPAVEVFEVVAPEGSVYPTMEGQCRDYRAIRPRGQATGISGIHAESGRSTEKRSG